MKGRADLAATTRIQSAEDAGAGVRTAASARIARCAWYVDERSEVWPFRVARTQTRGLDREHDRHFYGPQRWQSHELRAATVWATRPTCLNAWREATYGAVTKEGIVDPGDD